MTDDNHTCMQCGTSWYDIAHVRTEFTFCKPECADAWFDAHPEEKKRQQWLTRQDAVDRLLLRAGLLTAGRSVTKLDGN